MKKFTLAGILLLMVLNITACSLKINNVIKKEPEQIIDDVVEEPGNQPINQESISTSNQAASTENEISEVENHTAELANQSSDQIKSTTSEGVQIKEQLEKDLIEVVPVNTSHKIYKDYDTLFNDAELIIIGEVKNDILNDEVKIYYYEYDPSKFSNNDKITSEKIRFIQAVYTLREIKIDRILKGSIEGNSMKVAEVAGVIEEGGRKKMIISSDYSSMQKGNKYLLFLSTLGSEYYHILGVNQGKFNIDGKDMNEKESEARNTQFSQLKKEVLSKMKIE